MIMLGKSVAGTLSSAVSKILVIDDSVMMRLFLRRSLEDAGFDVEDWVALSERQIPDHITSLAPDLILTDYQMPGCNGATVARMAQKTHPRIPVVVLTAYRDKDMEAALLRFGVREILNKPIEAAALVQSVRNNLAAATPSA